MKRFSIGDTVRINEPTDKERHGLSGKIVEDISDSPAHKLSCLVMGLDPNQSAYKVDLGGHGTIPVPSQWLEPATVN